MNNYSKKALELLENGPFEDSIVRWLPECTIEDLEARIEVLKDKISKYEKWISLIDEAKKTINLNKLEEAKKILTENGYSVVLEDTTQIQMSNKKKASTGLPMNIWIDESGTYKLGRHGKRLKFQLDTNDKLNPYEFGVMDFDGILRTELPKKCKLTSKHLDALKNYIKNNKEALEKVADMEIWLDDIFPYMIKGGDIADNEQKSKLKKEIKKLTNNKGKQK